LPPLIPKFYRLPLPLYLVLTSAPRWKWDGTGQGQVKERGKDMGTFDIKSRQQGENHIIISRKGIGGIRPIYPRN
jgi:hypothetical protein